MSKETKKIRVVECPKCNTQIDKGASFDLGLNGNMVHLWDKVVRYRNMVESEADPNFESIEDTLRDIIGYAVIGLHILKLENNG